MSRPAPSQPRALAAVIAIFALDGLVIGLFGGSLPGLRERLDLGGGAIVAVLMAAGLAAVVAMQASGRLSDRYGARVPSFAGAAVMAASLLVVATAPGLPALLAGAVLLGLGNGCTDVAMNALGVAVEHARGASVMSRLHAFFSIGNVLGAVLVALLGGWHVAAPMLLGTVLVVSLMLATWPSAPQSPPVAHPAGSGPRTIPPLAWALAVMAVCFGLTEGTGIDWSSLHVTDVTGVGPAQGAWGLACVSGFMVVIRLFGDHAVDRFGRRRVVAVGSTCALVGYLLCAVVTALPVVLAAWCLVGFGVGLIAPQIYGLAGRIGGGRVLALVVSFGYAAFLTGPALIGFIATTTDTADRAGIANAMLLPAVTAVALVLLSRRLPHEAS